MPTACKCPKCNKYLSAPDELLGQDVQCPSCDHIFVARAAGTGSDYVPPPPLPPRFIDEEQVTDDYGTVGGYQERERLAPADYDEEEREYRMPRRVDDALPGGGKATLAMICLGLSAITLMVDLAVVFALLRILRRPGARWENVAEKIAQLQQWSASLYATEVGVGLVTIVAFLVWIYSANKNLELLDVRGKRFTPGWSVGWFFIPIANLFMPYQVMQEIWKASTPRTVDPYDWQNTPMNVLVLVWWLTWLGGRVLLRFSDAAVNQPNMPLEQFANALTVGLVGDAVAIVAAFLALYLVYAIRLRQVEKYELLALGGADRGDPVGLDN